MLRASTSKDDGQDSKAKRPKTVHNCDCSGKCQTNRCFCVRERRGCGSTCKCKSKCKNVYSHLEYFFGADGPCDVSPCFERWLLKNGKNGVETIDRNALRNRITSSANFSELRLTDEWKAGDAAKNNIAKTQELFRMVFSKSSDLYYSFCEKNLLEGYSYWHCTICKTCNTSRAWHCTKCNRCTNGLTSLCERCPESSSEGSSEETLLPFTKY